MLPFLTFTQYVQTVASYCCNLTIETLLATYTNLLLKMLIQYITIVIDKLETTPCT